MYAVETMLSKQKGCEISLQATTINTMAIDIIPQYSMLANLFMAPKYVHYGNGINE